MRSVRRSGHMARSSASALRTVGILLMTALVAIAMFDPVRDALPGWHVVVAVGVVAIWMLAQRYEREVVVEAGLADRDDIQQAERNADRWLF